MALAERTWEHVGERKRDLARLIESAIHDSRPTIPHVQYNSVVFSHLD